MHGNEFPFGSDSGRRNQWLRARARTGSQWSLKLGDRLAGYRQRRDVRLQPTDPRWAAVPGVWRAIARQRIVGRAHAAITTRAAVRAPPASVDSGRKSDGR